VAIAGIASLKGKLQTLIDTLKETLYSVIHGYVIQNQQFRMGLNYRKELRYLISGLLPSEIHQQVPRLYCVLSHDALNKFRINDEGDGRGLRGVHRYG
jgi:hypothetical protein